MFLYFAKLGWQKRLRQSKHTAVGFAFFVCFAFLYNWFFSINPTVEFLVPHDVTIFGTWKQNTFNVTYPWPAGAPTTLEIAISYYYAFIWSIPTSATISDANNTFSF